nr:NAD(P)/FAD-dependent oxidoreductase [Nocardioides convexus]
MSTSSPSVIVVGAGFGGLATAHHLRAAGITDITVLERADDIGGVWRDNTYPGAACDVPSSLYSWSFAPKHDWSHRYARQPEIHAYIREQATAGGLRDLVRTGAEVASAAWADGRWTVRLTSGEELTAEVLVSAVGQALRARRPRHRRSRRLLRAGLPLRAVGPRRVPGGQAGRGDRDRRQRDPVRPRDRPRRRAHDGVPALGAVRRPEAGPHLRDLGEAPVRPASAVARHRPPRGVQGSPSRLNKALDSDGGAITKVLDRAWHLHLRQQVKDPALRARLVPDYPLGCKRLLFSNDWYPALVRDDVDVVTDRIAAVEAGGVRTADGVLHEADVVILGTGFAATDFLASIEVTGRGGRRLHDAWKGGARAHLGITVPDFPGFFILYGPNTNLGGRLDHRHAGGPGRLPRAGGPGGGPPRHDPGRARGPGGVVRRGDAAAPVHERVGVVHEPGTASRAAGSPPTGPAR